MDEDGCLSCIILGGALPVFLGGLYVYHAIVTPAKVELPLYLLLDTVSLAIILFCVPATFQRARKHAALYCIAGTVFLALAFTKQARIDAALHILGLQAASVAAWIRWPTGILTSMAVVACLGYILHALAVANPVKSVLKRGTAIRPPRLGEGEQGITVGTFKPGILPADMRQFAAAEEGAKITLPADLLTRGISILGDPGSGKSRLMRLLHDEMRRLYPDIPVLIHDPKGEWLRTYYDPATDLIFAPYDKRSVNWDLFAEIKKQPQLLSSIVSTAVNQHHGAGGGENLYWVNSAAAIVQEQLETSRDLMSFRDGLLKWRDDHKDEKTALSAFSSARPAIKDIAAIALADGQGGSRTMDQFLSHRGRIFLLNSPMQTAEQNGAFAIFLSAFVLSCLSKPDAPGPRACAIIDEALTFHLPPAVEQAVSAQSRSKGLVVIAGAQWLPRDERRLLTRAEFTFGMKVGDLKTAKTLAELVGNTIYDEESLSKTKGSSGSSAEKHESTSTSQQERQRELMPPEAFRSLPPRSFVLLHQAGIAPGSTAAVQGEQRDDISAFDYQPQPLVSEYMKVL
jgi:hypothetical protein